MPVDDVQRELQYDVYKDRLRVVTGVWKKLQSLEAWARRDEKVYLPKYKDFLARAIKQVSGHDHELLTDEQALAEAHAVALYMARRYEECDLGSVQVARGGLCMTDWCAKWLPKASEKYELIFKQAEATPTRAAFRELQSAFDDLLAAYLAP